MVFLQGCSPHWYHYTHETLCWNLKWIMKCSPERLIIWNQQRTITLIKERAGLWLLCMALLLIFIDINTLMKFYDDVLYSFWDIPQKSLWQTERRTDKQCKFYVPRLWQWIITYIKKGSLCQYPSEAMASKLNIWHNKKNHCICIQQLSYKMYESWSKDEQYDI